MDVHLQVDRGEDGGFRPTIQLTCSIDTPQLVQPEANSTQTTGMYTVLCTKYCMHISILLSGVCICASR